MGDKLSLRLDGAELLTKTVTTRSVDTTNPLFVGGRPDGVHATNLKVSDVVIYKGAVSTADLAKVEAYLKTKNGI